MQRSRIFFDYLRDNPDDALQGRKPASKAELQIIHDAASRVRVDKARPRANLDPLLLESRKVFVKPRTESGKIAVAAYKVLRTKVLQQTTHLKTNCLMVVGPDRNVGKTLTSINLALAIARQGRKVILADFDLRSPSIASVLGISVGLGIGDVALGNCSLQEAILETNVNGLSVLPGSCRYEDSSELLLSETMLHIYEEFYSMNNTFIVIDTPPILACDDVKAISPHFPASLLVIRQSETSRTELRRTLKEIGSSSTVVGLALNRSTEANFDAYYY